MALIRNGAIPKSDEWVQVVLNWFIVHGFFIVKKKSQKSLISAVRITPLPYQSLVISTGTQLHSVPSPPYSDHLRRQCRERLLGCLADLTQLSTVSKTAEKVQKITGVTSDGELWISRVVQVIQQLEQDSKHVALLLEFDQEDRGKLVRARKTVDWLRKVRLRFVLLMFSCELILYVSSRVIEENRQRASSYSYNPLSFNFMLKITWAREMQRRSR